MATKSTVEVDLVALAARRLAGMVTKSPATVVLRDPPAAGSIEGDEIRGAARPPGRLTHGWRRGHLRVLTHAASRTSQPAMGFPGAAPIFRS